MLPAESLPRREPDEAKPGGLYTCQVTSGPNSKHSRIMLLKWDGSYWRYFHGYRFKNTVLACYGPFPDLEFQREAHNRSPQSTTN